MTNTATPTAPPAYSYNPRPTGAPHSPPFSEMSKDSQRNAGSFAHLLGFTLGWVGALFGYLVFRHRGELIRSHYATALNFQLSFLIYTLVLGILFIVPVLNVFLVITFLTLRIVFAIVPAKQAHRAELARIPLTITFVR